MRITFISGLGTVLLLLVFAGIFATATGVFADRNSPPYVAKPQGLVALEEKTDSDFKALLANITARGDIGQIETVPPVNPDAPLPSGTYLYNNLLENLLSGLHYFYPVPGDTPSSVFVSSWDAENGDRVVSDFMLPALENNVNYLLTLELYRKLHAKAIFDQDIEYARARVNQQFAADWHTTVDWPLGVYFDLIELYKVTDDETYLGYAERFAVGDNPDDANTPLTRAKEIAFKFNLNFARQSSPFHFYYAALLADYGNRHNDPSLVTTARSLFTGLKNMLYDTRYKMLWKRATVPEDNSTNVNLVQTFDTLEQVSAIRAIVEYGRASGDPEAASLAKSILDGMWGEVGASPLLIEAPQGMPETTYYGLYTAYDRDREAERSNPNEITIDQILFHYVNILVNEEFQGQFRESIDFLENWLEDNGPMYSRSANGYFVTYGENWTPPERPMVSSQASIWMARALAEDEWYRYNVAQSLATSLEEGN
ncbi:MAG: hypothetical protein NTY09_07395 [bacterium]|nr:hypothetical protein [bacterium]